MNGPETNTTAEPAATADTSSTPTASGASGTAAAPSSSAGQDRRASESAGTKAAEPGSLSGDEAFQINCLRNARYHEDRERYYSRLHRWTMFVVVVTGTATITSLLIKVPEVATASAIFSALSGAMDLVFDVSGRAKLHASLRQRFYALLAAAIANESTLTQLRKTATLIYADEPPCMHAVNAIAYNGAMDAYGRPQKKKLLINLHHRMFRNILSFATTSFISFEEKEERRKAKQGWWPW